MSYELPGEQIDSLFDLIDSLYEVQTKERALEILTLISVAANLIRAEVNVTKSNVFNVGAWHVVFLAEVTLSECPECLALVRAGREIQHAEKMHPAP